MPKPIDFDAQYARYVEKWMRAQLAAGKKPEEMEEQAPEVYMRFANHPADWLGGETPALYFQRFADPEELIALLKEYEDADMSAPNLLLDRVTDLGEASVGPLLALAGDASASRPLRITALNSLIELGSVAALDTCISIVLAREQEDDLADVAAEMLRYMGELAKEPMLRALETASDEAADTFLDLLCNFSGLERVYEEAERRFLADPERRALHATFLARLGDPRALGALNRAIALSDINYLDYIEIRNAIEELGGEPPAERDFAGDPYYESMKRLES